MCVCVSMKSFFFHTESILLFSYDVFWPVCRPEAASGLWPMVLSHGSLIDIWSMHMPLPFLEREHVSVCLSASASAVAQKLWKQDGEQNPPLCQVKMDFCLWRCIVTPSLFSRTPSTSNTAELSSTNSPLFLCSDLSQLHQQGSLLSPRETGGYDC